MAIKPGTILGTYEILSPLGAGGMGEVYLAKDAKLDRQIAIKVLPAALTQDPERVARFEREAKVLASLNHPNIAALYGFDESDGTRFLVMEYVEGDTLAHHLGQGTVPVEEALDIVRQIALALETAHDQGVIHRDLKPANVMIRPDETVKVLDFGLAKAMGDEPTAATSANSPTITANYTRPGVVLGTAAYMSPEQARGRKLDKRTDIWSLGIILFECLTGQRLFQGETANDSMGAIMHKDPDWSLLPPGTPPTIQLLLRRCLTKDRKRRLHDIADARVEIEEAIGDPTSSSVGLAYVAMAGMDRKNTARSRPGIVFASFLLGAVLVGGLAYSLRPEPEPKRVRRFEFAQDLKPRHAEISPDGTMVAFASEKEIYLRQLSSGETRLLWDLVDAEPLMALFWAPDSQRLGVQLGSKFWRIDVPAGQPIQVGDHRSWHGPAWLDDGNILFCDFKAGSLVQIPDRGGTAQTLAQKTDTELHLHPGSPLPKSRGVLFCPHPNDAEASTLCVLTPDGERKTLFTSAHEIGDTEYAATGHIMFAQREEPMGTWALPFSLEKLEVTGDPFLVLPKHMTYSVSDTGDLVYTKAAEASKAKQLVWVDRTGKELEEVGPTLYGLRVPSLSPDGLRVAVTSTGLDAGGGGGLGDRDLWIVDLRRGTATQLASEEGQQSGSTWSPDGKRIAYTSMRTLGDSSVRVRSADGSGDDQLLLKDAVTFSLNDDWSIAAVMTGDFTNDIWISTERLGDNSERSEFQNGPDWDMAPRLRPGGSLIAYTSGEVLTPTAPLFLRRFPEGEGRWQVSMKPVGFARWSRAGDRLYFIQSDGAKNTFMEVEVTINDTGVQLGDPTPLFPVSGNDVSGFSRGFDVGLDDERFLMIKNISKPGSQTNEEGIVIVENWFEEFRKRER